MQAPLVILVEKKQPHIYRYLITCLSAVDIAGYRFDIRVFLSWLDTVSC